MKKSTTSALAIGLMALTACGGSGSSGGGGGGGGGGGSVNRDAQYGDLLTTYEAIEDGGTPALDVSSRAGQATMNGIVGVGGVGDDGNLEAIGDLTIAADFDADVATGSASGFTLFDAESGEVDSELGGTLAMTNGTISGTDFDGTLSGTLTDEGDSADLTLILDGEFYDSDGTLIVAGDADATITESDGTVLVLEGGFIAVE